MTTPEPRTIIHSAEPVSKPPPRLETGLLAWVYKNLFSSLFDSIITIGAALLVISTLVSFVSWTVGSANWYAINFNLRLLMVGRYEGEYETRMSLAVALIAVVIGLCLAAWSRIRLSVAVIALVIVVLAFVLPVVIDMTTILPPAYFAAGEMTIKSGGAEQTPQTNLGFTGRQGEIVTLRLAEEFTGSDEAMSSLTGFSDQSVGVVYNISANRLTGLVRQSELDALLAGDSLTANQRARLEIERSKLQIPDSAPTAFLLNQSPVAIRVLMADAAGKLSLLEGSEVTFVPGEGTRLEIRLPQDGWYVLEKKVQDPASIAILGATGIYPILLRSITEALEGGGAKSIDQFERAVDNWDTIATRPKFDGRSVPFTGIIDNQYRGDHSFADYMRLYISPFLKHIQGAVWTFVATVALGYIVGLYLPKFWPAQLLGTPASNRALRSKVALWALVAAPVLAFVIILGGGEAVSDTRRWGGLLLTMMLTVVGIVASLPFGILLALGRRSSLPAISTVSTLYIELVRGVPFITVLFMAQLLIPLINPTLAEFPGVYRAMVATVLFSAAYVAEIVRGGLQAVPHGQEEAAKALGLNSLQVTYHITLPQALRVVIPPMLGTFVGLFKDTSLVAIVGLIDLMGIANNIYTQTEFLSLRREVFMFISVIYFVFSYMMAAISRRIEESGAGAALTRKI